MVDGAVDFVVEEGGRVEVHVVPPGGGVGGARVEGGEAEHGVAVGVGPEGPQVTRGGLKVYEVELKWRSLSLFRNGKVFVKAKIKYRVTGLRLDFFDFHSIIPPFCPFAMPQSYPIFTWPSRIWQTAEQTKSKSTKCSVKPPWSP